MSLRASIAALAVSLFASLAHAAEAPVFPGGPASIVGVSTGHESTCLLSETKLACWGAGGYGAALTALHHPDTYQVVESWSGYFVPTDPDGNKLDLGSDEANADASAHTKVPKLEQEFARYPRTFFSFYIGNKDPYPGFVDDNVELARELKAARIPHVFRIYDGAHDRGFWNRHQDDWLSAAVARLDPAA